VVGGVGGGKAKAEYPVWANSCSVSLFGCLPIPERNPLNACRILLNTFNAAWAPHCDLFRKRSLGCQFWGMLPSGAFGDPTRRTFSKSWFNKDSLTIQRKVTREICWNPTQLFCFIGGVTYQRIARTTLRTNPQSPRTNRAQPRTPPLHNPLAQPLCATPLHKPLHNPGQVTL
jgi:hypothetical protein